MISKLLLRFIKAIPKFKLSQKPHAKTLRNENLVTKFIDRDTEYALFEKLLRFEDDTRLLAIQDDGGMGKTNLMQKLGNCSPKSILPRISRIFTNGLKFNS